ncbi:uncharacterized protein [Rutidosis leptorrhynchoides]|uniref:uncharacterized protein n=1 Tax=Rutidosis leptorrhynchoides TaxID=125765 RepID=UPI003A991211
MTSSPSPLTDNQCTDVVTDAANLSKNINVSDEDVEDEEGDLDFNPFLKEAPSLEASSSLSSEIEESNADFVESREDHTNAVNETNAPNALQDNDVQNVDNGQQTGLQAAEENMSNIATVTITDVPVEEHRDTSHFQEVNSDDEDAIWRRTRARYSLVGSTLDELETFLQETDDEDDIHHNIDDEEEYRKFLAAVLLDEDSSLGAAQANENVDEDEDNDADFELELEEALGSDGDEILPSLSKEQNHEHVGRRPETRQKKRQKTDTRQNKFSGQTNRPLRPIIPYTPIVPLLPPNARNYMNQSSSSTNNAYASAFTPDQIGQLHCLMYEHVQLLVQVFSLSVLEPSRQHISTQVRGLLSEILDKRDQVLTSQRVPYPSFCFSLPYIRSTVTLQNMSESSSMDGFSWVPFVSNNVLSVIDVAPLNLVQSYVDDVSLAVKEHQQRQLQVSYDATINKECLFPFESFDTCDEPTTDKDSDQRSKKTLAATLVERCKKQSIALVPKEIANLALRFFSLFNPALFPHKPPPVSVANRVLFTDAEDGLLARGLMKHNTNWKEIQKDYLPCKTPHQIFVRQKNRACSRAPENPIKAVRRMKTSPLTPQEKTLIEEGLKVYRLDWVAVWKYMVPYRDPSLLARQWRTAIGNQKSYKGDDHTKAKRRLYESKRRKSKHESQTLPTTAAGQNGEGWSTEEDVNAFPSFHRCQTLSDKENLCNNGGGENNSGDEGGNNEEEAYVHEAFLADWRPGHSNSGQNPPVEIFTQNQLTGSSGRFSTNIIRSSGPELNRRGYQQPLISDRSRVVRLAPGLPPVNLPPTVRIMSQSAFSKYQENTSHSRTGQINERNAVRCSTSDAVEKGDSEFQMHPLLFQEEDGRSLPYYPLNGSGSSSSSFDFFPNNSPQLNVNLLHYSNEPKNTLNFFNNTLKSKELNSSLSGVDFHPLLQRTDDCVTPLNPELPANSSLPFHGVPPGPNELDLDIRLSTSAQKENARNARVSIPAQLLPSSSHGVLNETGNDPDLCAGSVGNINEEIVMEQEELSDSEDEELEESVEFECEEMTDSEGEGEYDSDHAENIQHKDLQDDNLQNFTVHGDDGDQNEEPRSLLGLNLSPKLAVTRNSNANGSLKDTTSSQAQLESATLTKKPRKRAQKLNPR